jgi:uncharacterized protein (DUF2141 family)
LVRLVLCAVAVVGLVPASTVLATERPLRSNELQFHTVLRQRGGVVRCGLFTRNGWLKKPVRSSMARANTARPVCLFRGVRPGTYGLSAFHDKNGNGRLDTNFLGIPTEDYCASNDARGFMGPPSFEDAKFTYTGGSGRVEARMK